MSTFRFSHSFAGRHLWRGSVIASLALMGACSDATAVDTSPATHVRIVNALVQSASDGSASTRAIDYLFDSLLTAPSIMNLAANGLSVGDSANGYLSIERGLHSYVARLAGDTTAQGTVYTGSTNARYLPKQRLSPGVYYTLVVAGVIPAFGPIPDATVPFVVLADDPFPAPQFDGVYQARFQVINAAPYASPNEGEFGTVQVYVTPEGIFPTDPTQYEPLTAAAYRRASKYLNVDAGTYVLTLVSSETGDIVAQQSFTVAAGDIRTFILRSTSDGPPSIGNHVLTNVLDHRYGP